MNSRIPLVLAALGALVLSQPAIGQPQEKIELSPDSPVRRIVSVGADGGYFYDVDCKNRKEGSVEVYEDPRRVCASPQDKERKCQPAWLIEDAAAYTCR